MDGVLADTGPIHFESWVKLGKVIGVEFSKELFEQIFGQHSTTITTHKKEDLLGAQLIINDLTEITSTDILNLFKLRK